MKLPEFPAGEVWLVGAGPGDAGLLTLHAVNALEQADVVVYDALVGGDTLAYARNGAELVLLGKRGGGLRRNRGKSPRDWWPRRRPASGFCV